MILRALFRLFTLALEIGEAWERFTAPPAPREPRPLLFGWCLDCGPEGTLERAAPGERLPARRGRRRPHVRFTPAGSALLEAHGELGGPTPNRRAALGLLTVPGLFVVDEDAGA